MTSRALTKKSKLKIEALDLFLAGIFYLLIGIGKIRSFFKKERREVKK